MLLKVIGFILIMFSTTYIGFNFSKKLCKREEELVSLYSFISMLETEISYSITPLPEALFKISKKFNCNIGKLFSNISSRLYEKTGKTVYDVFLEAIDEQKGELYLNSEDLKIVEDFGKTLGQTDIDNQIKHIILIKKNISVLTERAREFKNKYARLYNMLGFLAGLMIFIILI